MPEFSHLHVHTQFSLLDGAADISALYQKAQNDGQRGMAITDHGNMFGVFKFVAEAYRNDPKKGVVNVNDDGTPKVKPIVGCEFYLVENRHKKQFSKEDKDVRYHQLFLAKNPEGYKNLVKLCSLGYMEGLYGKYPRIDKELVLQYHKGLIATTCCLGAEVPKTILKKGEEEGEKMFKWWLDIFGEDYYVELQRHDIPDQNKVNEVLLKFAQKYNVKVIASNDSHYVDQQDYNAHDILLCINTGEKQATPVMKDFDDEGSKKGTRFAFYNDQFYFKTKDEMQKLFSDVPQALDNTGEIVDKVEALKLKQDIMLPNFVIPEIFTSQDEYLRHLTFEGARKRYKELTPEIEERLNFELFTIKTMGFAGYFLITADFIVKGKDIGVFVGPGRGSAAGSAVAYCIGITNIDPIKYNLLFERFLNPDRKSMPDIDTDFDDEGRQKVIDYVVEKYGKNQVAHIITYGTMAAKMSIKDVARVMDLPLQDSNMLAKLVPDKPGIKLSRVFKAPLEGEGSLKDKEALGPDDIENVKKLREIAAGTDLAAKVLKEAQVLEGSVRGTGIHAAGIIIAPKDLSEIVPVSTAKDVNLLITQYEGSVIEDAGVIKMDFLGLKTLTIIRDALKLIKQNHGITIEIDEIPLDDSKTLELYQKGETNGTFQFESAGMQKYLKELKPDKFEDLIAMNALYRPGPLEYIPNFISRKHGREEVTYDLQEMAEYLEETYGITVYQEQVMLLSQKLANFTKGDADTLRKAMGKKQKDVLDKMKSKFMDGAKANGHDLKICEKIWSDWEAFAQYAFNKSHSTCYAFVAFQTGFLKAHYPAEFMASVLTHNLNNIEKITFFMEECKRMGLMVLGPDINESEYMFTPNKKGEVRFGLGAIKGIGEAAVEAIVKERKENGHYTSIFDVVKRVELKAANKKCFENLVLAGAFDSFEIGRAQYFHQENENSPTYLEKVIKYGASVQDNVNAAPNLFGESDFIDIAEPPIPPPAEWSTLKKLSQEKEVVGIFISGHPLDDYKLELKYFKTNELSDLKDVERFKGKDLAVAGIVTAVRHGTDKNGKPYGFFTVEDYSGPFEMRLFSDDYVNFSKYMIDGFFLLIKGKFKSRFKQNENFEFKVQSIHLLSDLKDKFVESVELQMHLSTLDEQLIDNLDGLIQSSTGSCKVRFMVFDNMENIKVEMRSKRQGITLSREFVKQLNEMKNISYVLNPKKM
jgi:DNA polymerase III subunit alpha